MTKPTIALVRYQLANQGLKESIELCDGFKDLKPDDRVLIKPNLVGPSRSGSGGCRLADPSTLTPGPSPLGRGAIKTEKIP